ncbi:helix-turn-helix domain-containing protein [Desulfotignum phosphitoxidans]|jgi:DNA-binding XRE family transcriptional regulator|uniref:Transcriptional regulator, XRE family n=1 Tax=Desulfotignum phosphitoxidans DSM 13687 TaxID=1286635 RepID=S0FZC6_9BACT|nr:helix-turn-helix transcriptional regulator [Desulfotignum phosphitoxidans]EMS80488.1 transcriptional regulator, XRE family [Desulfotignum phosphitoxidans DSM 13687]
MGKSIEEKHREMLVGDPEYAQAFAGMEEEFQLARELIRARIKSGLTQKQLAEKMGTTQSSVARLESGSSLPSLRSLKRYAYATGSKMRIYLES